MSRRIFRSCLALVAEFFLACHSGIALTPVVVGQTPLATLLNWIPENNTICHGYYVDLPINFPPSLGENYYLLHSDNVKIYQDKPWVYTGNVTVKEPDREVLANKAYSFYDNKADRITRITAYGNVRLREPGILLVANAADIHLADSYFKLHNVAYRMLRDQTPIQPFIYQQQHAAKVTGLNARGTANQVERIAPQIYQTKEGSFSTCPPSSCAWMIKSHTMVVNEQKKRVTAHNATFWFFGAPVLYTPYLTFSYDNTRKSGFLSPDVTFFSTNNGFGWGQPYYFNLAPNVDMLFTPTWYSKRGVQLNDTVRYLTWSTLGNFFISALPGDRAFTDFRQQSIDTLPPSIGLDRLKAAPNYRGYLSWQQQTQLTPLWSSLIDLNYVTDDYYFRDFGGNNDTITQGQIKQQVQVQFQSQHWSLLSELLNYQTLHPVDATPFQDQYARWPELQANASYPIANWGLNYHFAGEYTNFRHPVILNGGGTNLPPVEGSRFDVNPSLDYLASRAWGYLKSSLQWDNTGYLLTDFQPAFFNTITPLQDKNILRSLPTFAIDSGLYFDRTTHLLRQIYTQTLEPRLFYTFTPFEDQRDIPLFDTSEPIFDFSSIFRTNRFQGIDRLGDANQFGLGLTTRLFNQYTGAEMFDASIGEIVFLEPRRVKLTTFPTVNEDNESTLSPIAGNINYYLIPHLTLTGDLSWDPNQSVIQNDRINATYSLDNSHLVSLGYSFQRLSFNDNENIHLLDAGATWPLIWNWHIYTAIGYNLAKEYTQNYLAGLEYDTCCWAVRFVASREFTFLNSTNNQAQFNDSYYFQWLFKGIGSAGSNNPSSLLQSRIPGYQDNFENGF